MESRYYLLKKDYAVVTWDEDEASPLSAKWRWNKSNYSLGPGIGTLGGKTNFWASLLTESQLSDFLAKRQVSTLDEWYNVKENQRLESDNLRAERIKMTYNELLSKGLPITTTPESISIVLAYLRIVNWGVWELPPMSIGYRCAQYDCDGKIAVTMILSKPIDYYGEMVNRFVKGAPVGHLMKYRRI